MNSEDLKVAAMYAVLCAYEKIPAVECTLSGVKYDVAPSNLSDVPKMVAEKFEIAPVEVADRVVLVAWRAKD